MHLSSLKHFVLSLFSLMLVCRAGDQTGKIKWRSGVTCALSAEKSGIFKKTGRKHAGQIVWHLDAFKAKAELQRYWIADSEDHDQAQS